MSFETRIRLEARSAAPRRILRVEKESAQFGASGAGIFVEFVLRGFDGFFENGFSKRVFVTDADGEMGRACARVLPGFEGIFDASVFAAMEGNDGQPAAGLHPFGDVVEEGVDGFEFAV